MLNWSIRLQGYIALNCQTLPRFSEKNMHVAFPMSSSCRECFVVSDLQLLIALKEPVTTAAGDEFATSFLISKT